METREHDLSRLFRLDEKIALVTGGSRGLGRGMALALASLGADIALIGRDADRLAAAADSLRVVGTGVWTYVFDLEDHDRFPDVYQAICADTGGVDILVNNAAVPYRAPAEAIDIVEWQRMLDVGLTAAFKVAQVFAQERIASGRSGKIINVGSLMCHGSRPGTAAYTAMKSGLHGLTRALAVEWARYGITVNTLAPGYYLTDLTREIAADPAFDAWVKASTPMGRWGDPERDLAGAVVFLASAASDFVTGQIIYVDGGWTAAL